MEINICVGVIYLVEAGDILLIPILQINPWDLLCLFSRSN